MNYEEDFDCLCASVPEAYFDDWATAVIFMCMEEEFLECLLLPLMFTSIYLA